MSFKTVLFVIISLIGFMTSCSDKKSEADKYETAETVEKITESTFLPLYVIYVTHEGSGNNLTRNDSIGVYSYKYLEISLSLMTDGGLGANGNAPFSEDNKKITIRVSDEEGEELRFSNSNEFLNFMADRGYDFMNQSTSRYENNYILKKNDKD